MSSRFSELNDVAWLREKYEVERLSTCQIAERLKCNSTTVSNALRRCEIPRRRCSEVHGYAELNDVKWLRQKYEVEMLSIYKIGEILGCAPTSVHSALCRGKIATRSVSEGNMAKNPSRSAMLKNVEWLREKYEVELLSTRKIGNILRCTPTTVSTALHRAGVHVRGISEANMINNLRGFALLNNVKWLRQKYEVEMLSTLQIADIVGCFPPVVNSALRRNSIYVRSSIESQKRGELHPRYGTHLSEQTKQKLRIARTLQRFPSHHTKPELQFEAICRKYSLPFKYTGDGALWIGSDSAKMNPDFCSTTTLY
jgi:DNA-binding CsgD family transcriptional regulator